ncbi:hypothetical protein CYLTODRAFT_287512 [Cylindrobasidium torrendii FP15055 ss-10]|uniref:Cullin family profile domain-containing protein n=1 Tax=Cylindrobasidium torrendii FP15055 ss-10 TaxID=1314674 RepID=A0A0D7ATV0_9AGAR|nr:hypothetical protein CYLTODRAFT_287512 [Cylindrobasidium torrendii FP15055 ss-10]
MQAQLEDFKAYYNENHPKRALMWLHSLGTASLVVAFKQNTKTIDLGLFHARVMLLFMDEDHLTYEEIQGQVGLKHKDLKLVLLALACGKKKILRKTPKGPDVNSGDSFQFNYDFKDDKVKLSIASISEKITEEESIKTQDMVDESRKYTVQAAIVRIMKGSKELHNKDLVNRVVDAVRMHFHPDIPSIKKEIDWCIDNEYLARVEDKKDVFMYVA